MKAFKIVLELIRTQGEQCKVTGVVKQSHALEVSFKIKWSELRHSFFHTMPYTKLSVQKAKRRVLPRSTIYYCRAVTITPHKHVIKYPFIMLNLWLQRPLHIINIPRENPHNFIMRIADIMYQSNHLSSAEEVSFWRQRSKLLVKGWGQKCQQFQG